MVPSAVQIKSDPADNRCFWLGMELSDTYSSEFPNYLTQLIEPDNSAAGITLKIMNGEFCSGLEKNRELNINLICPDSTSTEWDIDLAKVITENVLEDPHCIYTIEFESPLACPKQCISTISSTKYSVCGTHGICVADPQAGVSRCICDEGFDGDLCSDTSSGVTVLHSGNDDLLTAIIIVVVFIALFCGIAVYLWFVWRKHMEMHKILNQGANEYFLGIDEEVEEDDDTIHGAHNTASPKTTDTFHPIVSVDVGTAKMIQKEHQKERKQSQSLEREEEEEEEDHDDNTLLTEENEKDTNDTPDEPENAQEQEQEQPTED
eukprot:CAMPEP_0201569448 /NCGR_PEP_ID=MMETSP0190_2-20130828/11112_1 /ASSEMBLY_ACC=CAM_ASM_000263 /TAXON_ID=37353 /ORGANISM="Rosalina sp." /LENGTH=319 /DNA_ID=CAMNT_0047991745 /DNA_START=226 /DNA_END=1185 /DNA_ORIENTATION=+